MLKKNLYQQIYALKIICIYQILLSMASLKIKNL